MITIDANLVYQTQYNVLNTRRVNKKAYESVDSYPEDYSTKNSTTQVNNDTNTTEINTGDLDLDAILKELKLHLPENRFVLLLQMKREDLINMLYLLDKDALGLGLKYFNKDKLCNYIMTLPKEEIIKIVTKMFSTQELLASIPTKEINKFLDSVKLEPGELMKVLKELPPAVLAQLYESATGESAGKMGYEQFIESFKQIDEKRIMEGFKALPQRQLLNALNKFIDNNPKLLLQFSSQALCTPILQSAKSKITEGMMVLDPEYLIKLLGQLPDKLLACVDTMLDPEKFTEVLLKYNKDLLLSAIH